MARVNHPLHPVAAKKLTELAADLEREFKRTATERKIVNALVYGATTAQLVGMLEAFTDARRTYNAAQEGQPGEAERKVGER